MVKVLFFIRRKIISGIISDSQMLLLVWRDVDVLLVAKLLMTVLSEEQ